MEVLVSGNPRDAKKASIIGSGRFAGTTLLRTVCCVPGEGKPLHCLCLMRTPRSYVHFLWLPQCPWGLRKTGICESGRNYSCPITRVSVRRTSTVIAFDSSERILILVFLWYKATNFRDVGTTAELAATTDFMRSISAWSKWRTRLRNEWLPLVS